MDIQAKGLDYRALNEAIRAAGPSCRITGCLGQRFIGAGMSGRRVEIDGIPGNALGAYLGGGSLTVAAAWAIRRAMPCGAARSMSKATRAIGQAST